MSSNLKHRIWNPEMECMSRDERLHLQGERLAKTVRLEYDNVPMYRERMDAAGIKPEDTLPSPPFVTLFILFRSP